jgi:hypothetical protein
MTTPDSIQDSTRYVVGSLHRGSILPGRRAEMWRDVYLEAGADVQGGIWCGSLSVFGADARVAESVYCRGPVRIAVEASSGDETSSISFESCLTTSDSLVIENCPGQVRFGADIYTDQLSISNAFVYGNIFANRAVIRDSIVLGGVFCRDHLTVERSLISTFDTGRAQLGSGNLLFFPGAVAREGINLSSPVGILTFYNLYRQQEGANGDAVLLDESDIIELTVTTGSDDEGGAESRSLYCLSVTERVLDSEPVKEHLTFNREFLEKLALRGHLAPGQSDVSSENSTDGLEATLWNILAGRPASSHQRLGSSIDQLFNRLGMASPGQPQ